MDNFKSKISEILEVEEVNLNDELESFEAWDSLTILSIIAMADESYKVQLSANDLKSVSTIEELQELLKSKMLNK